MFWKNFSDRHLDYVNNYCGQRLHTTSLCDRTDDVVAWRKIPRPYMNGFILDD